jgi:hypothetical protein
MRLGRKHEAHFDRRCILLVAPPAFAQADPSPSPTLNAERRSEQALPRSVVPFDLAHFDKYVGYYQLGPSIIFTVIRDGDHFFRA